MGKSPAKWFKSVLRRKKSSKSKFSEVDDALKSANKGEVLVASEVPVPNTTTVPSLTSQPSPVVNATSEVNSERGEAAKVASEGLPSSGAQANENSEIIVNSVSHDDADRIRLQTAATKAQTSFRGYQARCAYQAQKNSIIQLQAFVRGHLVRRQALTTLCCVRAIVKVQALARGVKVRHSAIGIEVQNACNLGKTQGKGVHTAEEKLIKNAFAQKIFASSKQAVPLSLQYNPGDPNSSQKWVERWTTSQFWVSHLHKKKGPKHDASKKVEAKQGRTKQSVRNHTNAIAENRPGRSVKESEKPKRTQKKIGQEHPESEHEKVNHNLRKTTNPPKEVRERSNVSGKPKRTSGKSSVSGTPEAASGTNDVAPTIARDADAEKSPSLPTTDNNVTPLQVCQDLDLQSMGINGKANCVEEAGEQLSLTNKGDAIRDLGLLSVGNNGKDDDVQGENTPANPKDHNNGNENQKINERRASLPPNVEHMENGVQSTPKVPSYMAPTESARAKLRGLGSPRFSQDASESIATTRRNSLPNSINGRLSSMSPRAQKLVSSAGKGLVNSNRSLSSSRDGSVSDKPLKAEWRR